MQSKLKKKQFRLSFEVKPQGQALWVFVDGAAAYKTQTGLFKESDLDLVTFDWSFLSQTPTIIP